MLNKKLIIIIICLPLLYSCALHGSIFYTGPEEPVEEYPALSHVNTVYVDSLGTDEGAGMVSEKIRLRLMKSKRFSVVEVPEKSDAILKGVAGVQQSVRGGGYVYKGNGSSSVRTDYAGYAVLRLMDAHTSKLIWSFEYNESCRGSVSSCVADATVEELIQDAARADEDAKNDHSLKK